MLAGDREAAARFMERYGSRIRRRVRYRLSPAVRRLFDSQDILSTVSRKLDVYIRSGTLRATNLAQLWSLLFRMTETAVIDRQQLVARLHRAETEDSEIARRMLAEMERAEQNGDSEPAGRVFEQAFAHVPDNTDREILSLWFRGVPQTTVSSLLELPPATVRKRWERIRSRLRPVFEAEAA